MPDAYGAGYFFTVKTGAQPMTDCQRIQQGLQNTLAHSKSAHDYYLSLSQHMQVYYETDSAAHRHISFIRLTFAPKTPPCPPFRRKNCSFTCSIAYWRSGVG